MAGVNKAIIIGRLGKDPETRHFSDGSPVCNFSVATSETWTDKQTGEKKEKTEWHRIVAFRKLAEICGKYLEKGKQVYIEGKLQTRDWESKSGEKHYITEIVADQVQFLGSFGESRSSAGGSYADYPRQPQQQSHAPSSGPVYDDDIPF